MQQFFKIHLSELYFLRFIHVTLVFPCNVYVMQHFAAMQYYLLRTVCY